jgi:TonB family protein
MSAFCKIGELLLRFVVGVISTCLLFSLLPLADMLLRRTPEVDRTTLLRNVTLTQVVKEEEKDKPEPQRRMRKLVLPSPRSTERAMASKFTPDLSVGGEGDGVVAVSEKNLENMVFEEGQTDEPAVLLQSSAPVYPRRAQSRGIGGVVSVIILIDRGGRAAKIDFERLPDELFRKPVYDAVSRWRFKPAYHQGVPVRIRVRQEFEFGVTN